MALTDVNRLLQPGGLTRGGAQTAAPDFDEAGRKAAFDAARSGINPVTKEPYTKADKKQFEEYFGVKFPESAPAQPSKPANPRAARAAARETRYLQLLQKRSLLGVVRESEITQNTQLG
jgi:hypothetical protein